MVGKPYTSGVWERARGKKRVLAFKHMVAKETRKLTSPKHETSRDTVTPWHRDTVTPTYETFMKPPVNLLRTVLILSRFQCLLRILDSSNKHIAIWSLGTSNTYVKSCDAGSSIPSLNFMFINLLLHHSTEVASMDYHLKGPSGLRLRGVSVYIYIYICMYIYIYIRISVCVCPLLWWSWIWFSGQIQDTIHIIQYPSPPPPCRRHGNTRAPDIQQPICGQTSDCFDDSKWFTLGAVANFHNSPLRMHLYLGCDQSNTSSPRHSPAGVKQSPNYHDKSLPWSYHAASGPKEIQFDLTHPLPINYGCFSALESWNPVW